MARFRSRFRKRFRRLRRYRPRSGGGRTFGIKNSTLLLLGGIGAGWYFFKDKILALMGKQNPV